MGKNILLEALRSNTKTGHLFNSNGTFITYKTGFPALDYAMGSIINVFDKKGKLKETYPSIGITAGSIVTVIGKTHVGKTSFLIGISANIVRPYKTGMVIHCDLEGGTNMTRVSALSKFNPLEIRDSGKYVLRQQGCSIEEIKMIISQIYKEKKSKPEVYQYDTGKVDEFGDPIIAYEPTCLIVDSVPSMTTYINEGTKDGQIKLDEVSSQTDKMRVTAEIGRFLNESMQMLKAANIILLLVNHIKDKPMAGPVQPELRYLKQNETMPAGKALQYYTNTLMRITSVGSEKYTMDDDGFEGFGVQVQFCKNRNNVDGTIVPLVFDKLHGYDTLRSSFKYAKYMGLIGGNRNGYYFIENKDKKFRLSTIHEDFDMDRDLYKIMYSHITPSLSQMLSSVKPEEMAIPEEEFNY